MILLASTSDKIQVVTGSTGAIDTHASFVDITTATSAITPGRTNTAQITTAATTDVVAAAASGSVRNLKALMIRNAHASTSNTVTVQHTDGTTVTTLIKVALAASETLQYNEADGWSVRDSTGARKQTTTAQPGQYLGTTVLTSSSGTFTTRSNTNSIRIRMVGGGGGGGGCTSVASANGAAGGGGAGGYLEKSVAVANGTGYSYTVGALGAGNSGSAGGNGGDSTFVVGATTYTAKGGTGGPVCTSANASSSTAGGAGGAVSTNGDVNGAGEPGQWGCVTTVNVAVMSGGGGSGPFGGGGVGTGSAGTGNAAAGFGSGGGGSATGASAARAGGAGTAGMIVVDEYT